MRALPEIERALSGHYNAVLRERITDEPAPSFGDIRRRGKVRVFTALPIWSDGQVIAVVRASRTGLDALSSLWANRRGLVWLALMSLVFVIGVSVAFSAAIASPLQRLTRAARSVALGGNAKALQIEGRLPREIGVLQEVMLQMASELEQREGYVQDFASQVSHELKTPITAIRGAAELLQQGLHDMPVADRQRFIGNILEDAQRMERLVTRLLALARLENERQKRSDAFEVVPWVERQLQRYGERVHLSVALPPEVIAIDPEQLASALINLVENALRYAGDSQVQVILSAEGTRLHIDVRDRGPGVSEANRKRLFERFFTTERDQGGTGLGLAIVRAIAEARGGRVAASFSDQGSQFTVVL
jgi:signal transduction histidine kinase